jgi:7-cyano-7-deazaguanine synthase in queuosine biosynthesis
MEDQEEPHPVVELEVAEAVAQELQEMHKHQPLVDLEEVDQVVGLEIVQQELEVAEEL